LDKTTSHSTKLANNASKSLVIPTGDGANEPLRDYRINCHRQLPQIQE
jgi:hypothetical protein